MKTQIGHNGQVHCGLQAGLNNQLSAHMHALAGPYSVPIIELEL